MTIVFSCKPLYNDTDLCAIYSGCLHGVEWGSQNYGWERNDRWNGKIRAAIVGSTGYGGVELIRLLDAHPKVEIAAVLSSSSAGEPLAAGYPHLTEIRTDVLEAIDPASLAKKADIVFLATPAGVATKLAPEMLEAGLDVIDHLRRLPAEIAADL